MRKITFLLLLLTSSFTFAQTYSTGVVNLTTGMTVKFDTNSTTVTMTLTGPSNVWLGLGIGSTSMGGGDCVIVSGTTPTLSDRKFVGTTTPSLDATNNWSVTSNTVAGSTRTVIATRALSTGDTAGSDYTFTNTTGNISLMWALGSSLTLNQHSSRGYSTATKTLSTDSFALAGFKMYPNPADELLAIELPADFESVNATIYDMTGKEVLTKSLTALENKIDVSALFAGNYIVKVASGDKQFSTNLIVE